MKDHWTRAHSWGTLGIAVGVVLVGLLVPNDARLWGWLGTLVLLTAFVAIAGHGITGQARGALIDERNKISLSRLQLVLWTLIVLSGYFTAALGNLMAGAADPLAIAIPQALWLLMGISTTSLIGSPLLKSNKLRPQQADQKEQDRTWALLAAQGTDTSKVHAQGLIVANDTPEAAQWSDLFKGEETGNAGLLDMAKVQMFYFTVILVLVYAITFGAEMQKNPFLLTTFPEIPASMLALLGISHAGYLTSKAVPHSVAQ
jgi:hypothetical protein